MSGNFCTSSSEAFKSETMPCEVTDHNTPPFFGFSLVAMSILSESAFEETCMLETSSDLIVLPFSTQ